jgi:gp16 family phage-associated protein
MARKELSDEERRARARARAMFSRVGYTIPQFAKELGVHPEVVRRVLKGTVKGTRGHSHKVAVALGIKDGVIVPEGTSAIEAMKMAEEVRS